MMSFSIGELSRRTGVNVETIRYYDRLGLLGSVARSPSGRRTFDASGLETLLFIRRCREMLFSIDNIRSLLPLRAQGPCSDVKALATAHLGELRTRLKTLAALEQKLTAAVSICPGDNNPKCSIIDLLSSPEKNLSAPEP
jgi:MerR family mercuric resistance operon transcriptional regulator